MKTVKNGPAKKNLIRTHVRLTRSHNSPLSYNCFISKVIQQVLLVEWPCYLIVEKNIIPETEWGNCYPNKTNTSFWKKKGNYQNSLKFRNVEN